MVVVLVVVPDALEPRLGLEVARVFGWAVAFPVWIVLVEKDWQTRFGPLTRVALQVPLWIAAALLAIWISDQTRFNWYGSFNQPAGTTAVASISTLAPTSTRSLTTTTDIAGKWRPTISR
jgi:hypothetical protein